MGSMFRKNSYYLALQMIAIAINTNHVTPLCVSVDDKSNNIFLWKLMAKSNEFFLAAYQLKQMQVFQIDNTCQLINFHGKKNFVMKVIMKFNSIKSWFMKMSINNIISWYQTVDYPCPMLQTKRYFRLIKNSYID